MTMTIDETNNDNDNDVWVLEVYMMLVFAGQPNHNSQAGYMVLLGSTDFWDSKQITHLLEWKSSKIDRKVASTLAAEANGASMAYGRSMYVRALLPNLRSPSLQLLLRVQMHKAPLVQQVGRKHVVRFPFV